MTRGLSASLAALLLAAACGSPRWRSAEEILGQRRPLDAAEQAALVKSAELALARPPPRTLERARAALDAWSRLLASDPSRVDWLARAAETTAWLADRSPEGDERERHARLGVEFAGHALKLSPDRAAAHYWRAVCLGLFTRERQAGALERVKEMAAHARRAAELEPGLDQGGPHRFLCRLLAQAPAFPVSIGDGEEAVEQGQKAVARGPDHPENHLALAAAYLQEGRPREAREHAARATALLERGGWEDAGRWREEARTILERAR